MSLGKLLAKARNAAHYTNELVDDLGKVIENPASVEKEIPSSFRFDNIFAHYKVEGAKPEKSIKGWVIDREIIKLPIGSNVKKLFTNLPNIRRDYGQPVVIQDFVEGYPQCIAVDVPAKDRRVVHYHQLARTPEWKKTSATLPLLCGVDPLGKPVIKDLAKMPHLLLAGMSGAGKSSLLHALILGLASKHSPDHLQFAMTDLKQSDLTLYENLPHLWERSAYSFEDAYNLADSLRYEMERRQQLFAMSKTMNLKQYNAKASKPLPYIVHVVDEMASIFGNEKHTIDEIELSKRSHMNSMYLPISQRARSAGIHMVLATQKPSKTAIPDDIQANITERICLTTASEAQSKFVINSPSAHYLLGDGDALAYNDNTAQYERLHCPWVGENDDIVRSVEEIARGCHA